MLRDYRAMAAELGVGERVSFAGAQPHPRLPELLSAGDLLVLATEPPESFGLVLVEAMAAGLPVIASNIPGVRTIPEDGKSGLLVGPGIDALTAAMRRRAADPGERDRMGAAARARAEAVYAWPRVLDRLEDVYSQAIAERRR
jgi:glycosyltransferase involved in cell wall biosynthesis